MTGYGLRRRDGITLGVLVLCVAALVTGVALVARGDTGGAVAAAPLPSVPPSVSTSGTPSVVDVSGPTPGAPFGPTPGVSATGRAPAEPARSIRLARSSLAIPQLSVTASIVGATVEDGVLEPPRNSTQVGLWGGSAGLAASSGTVTIAGHVNWAGMGPFAFARLATLRPGARVYTTAADGTERAWRVTSVSARTKASGIDAAAFAGADGARVLVLVTCGGTFDTSVRSYENNVYVYASPVPLQS